MKSSIIAILCFAIGLFLISLALGQATPDGTRVPPATQIVTLSKDIWSLGNKDAVLAGAFEILKNGVSLGAPRAGQLALCNGDIYAFSVRDQNWWRINANTWTHTVTIPCGVVAAVGPTIIPLQSGQTFCASGYFDVKLSVFNQTIWVDTPDCSHMRNTTLYKIQSIIGGVWCVNTTPPAEIWAQNQLPCFRPVGTGP